MIAFHKRRNSACGCALLACLLIAMSIVVDAQTIIFPPPWTTNVPPITPTDLPPPANDNFTNAIELPSTILGRQIVYSNVGATREASEPTHGSDSAPASLWWKWMPTRSSSAWIQGNSTRIAVYRGESLESLELVTVAGTGALHAWGFSPGGAIFTNEVGVIYWLAALSSSSQQWTNLSFSFGQKFHWVEKRATSVGKEVSFSLKGSGEVPGPASIQVRIESNTRQYAWTNVVGSLIESPSGAFWSWTPTEPGGFRAIVRATYATGDSWTTVEEFTITPRNDAFTDATEIPAKFKSGAFPFRTDFATSELSERRFGLYPVARTVWWRWTPDHDSTARLLADGSGLFQLEVFAESSISDLTRIAHNDSASGSPSWPGSVPVALYAGNTYFIRINDGLTGGGNGVLYVEEIRPAALSVLPKRPFRLGLNGAVGIYTLEATDLQSPWQLLGYVTNAVGTVEFTDPRSALPDHSIYRTRLVE